MRHNRARNGRLGNLFDRLGAQQGMVIVVVMMFCVIFLVLGLALYWLSTGQVKATETERRDVKSFNVAEAGVDAGMLALKIDWPFTDTDYVYVNSDTVQDGLVANNDTLDDPSVQVDVYDNSYEQSEGVYVTVENAPTSDKWILWDANGDGKMYVDSTSEVQGNTHRILLLAERQTWNLYFPVTMALRAGSVDSNAQGVGIQVEVPNPDEPIIYYDVNDTEGKGIDEFEGVAALDTHTDFNELITDTLINALEGIAKQKGTYFEDDPVAGKTGGELAQAFLTTTDPIDGSSIACGAVVYVKSAYPVNIGSGIEIGSEEFPTVVVIDSPNNDHTWDMDGNAEFYGILVVLGESADMAGTCSIHGAVYVEGTLDNSGNGKFEEIQYNYTVISAINRQYVLSVNVVSNSWEEYTGGASE